MSEKRENQLETDPRWSRASVIPKHCLICNYLGSDNDGNDPEFAISWPVCDKTYLEADVNDNTEKPGFPFTEEQPCYKPGFWHYLELDNALHKVLPALREPAGDVGAFRLSTLEEVNM